MKALIWNGGQDFSIGEAPDPTPEPAQVVVEVIASAVCGSDFHMDDFGAAPPLVLGHENAGTVVEVGSDCGDLAVGARVALNPVQTCGACWCCTNEIPHLCSNVRHLGSTDVPGGWAQYVAIDAANAHEIPEGVDFAHACLAEPVSVCHESFRRASLAGGDSVLIIGDGPFGFLHAQLARAGGAGAVVVAGHYDERLARIAATTGAATCNLHREDLGELLAERIGPPGVDIVIEATGSAAAPDVGIATLRPRGTIVIFSYIWQPRAVDMGLIHMRELSVLGSCRSLNAYRKCLDLMATGAIDAGALVDIQAPLEDHAGVFDRLVNDKKNTFKAVFLPQK